LNAGDTEPVRRLAELDRSAAWKLLSTMAYGRIVFTQNALPAIRAVNHLIDDDHIVVRTRLGAHANTVVAYEVDQLDPQKRLGWSVVVTGYAEPITDPIETARLSALLIPWVDTTTDTIIRIRPEIVTGFRLTE
jgi:hypothetical protein